jgi:hypothetical protein
MSIESTWLFCFAPGDVRSSVLRCAAYGASHKPHTSIGPAQEIDLVAGEIEASQKQVGDGLYRIDRKSGAQVLIGEKLVNDHSNARS